MAVKVKYTEEQLVEHLKSANQKQFEAIYDYFSGALYGVIKQIVNENEELAEDLLQDVFLKIWNNAASYNTEKSRLFTWVLNIARNTAIDHIRSKQGKNDAKSYSIDNFVSIADKSNNTVILHEQIGLKKVVNELKPEYKQIIDLAYFEGYTQDEIAKKLDMPLGTVKTRARMALQLLRKSMNL